jgi:hypothetical protein
MAQEKEERLNIVGEYNIGTKITAALKLAKETADVALQVATTAKDDAKMANDAVAGNAMSDEARNKFTLNVLAKEDGAIKLLQDTVEGVKTELGTAKTLAKQGVDDAAAAKLKAETAITASNSNAQNLARVESENDAYHKRNTAEWKHQETAVNQPLRTVGILDNGASVTVDLEPGQEKSVSAVGYEDRDAVGVEPNGKPFSVAAGADYWGDIYVVRSKDKAVMNVGNKTEAAISVRIDFVAPAA